MTDFVPPLVILGFGALLIFAAKIQKRWNGGKQPDEEKSVPIGRAAAPRASERRAA